MNQKNCIAEVKEAINVALLKDKAMHAIAGAKDKNKYAVMILAASALLSLIGQQFIMPSWATPSLPYGILMAVVQVVMAIVGFYIMSFIAKAIFKGTAKHDEFFRVAAYANIVGWLTIIPFLGIVSAIWGLVLIFVILKTIHKLTTGGAIGTIIVSVIIIAIVGMILSPVYAMLGLGGSPMMQGWKGAEKGFNFNIDGDEGNVQMKNGKMKITGEDGQAVEFEMPTFDYE